MSSHATAPFGFDPEARHDLARWLLAVNGRALDMADSRLFELRPEAFPLVSNGLARLLGYQTMDECPLDGLDPHSRTELSRIVAGMPNFQSFVEGHRLQILDLYMTHGVLWHGRERPTTLRNATTCFLAGLEDEALSPMCLRLLAQWLLTLSGDNYGATLRSASPLTARVEFVALVADMKALVGLRSGQTFDTAWQFQLTIAWLAANPAFFALLVTYGIFLSELYDDVANYCRAPDGIDVYAGTFNSLKGLASG